MQTDYMLFCNVKCVIKSMFFLICAWTSANLTGHVERVGIENFELLKVLGTGGE